MAAMRAASEHLRPPPDLLPSQWAEQEVRIPAGNALPGPLRFDNAPYQREPLDMTINPECRRISLMWGAQVGKTTLALCAQAYHVVQRPVSQMMMQPSQGDLATWLETKFNPLVEANESLRRLLAKPRGRKGVNNQRMKSFPGGFLMFSWAGSPKTMRGRSAPFIVCDETDGYDRTKEGHPVNILWQRAATFGDQRLLMEISTPLVKGESWIETSFENGDKRRFFVACPHCDGHQHLQWKQVTWSKDDEGNHLPETAHYTCEHCGVLWNDGERIAAIRNAEAVGAGWKAEKPFRGHASYHLNEMYSIFVRLQTIVESFLEKKAGNDLQTFVNVSLAETWEEEAEQLSTADLIKRATRFNATIPMGGLACTAGVDMQEDRLEVEVVAWGEGEESWSINYKVIWGDPLEPEVWADLDDHLSQTFQHENGSEMTISATCLDSGGRKGYTQAAYDYARERYGKRIYAIKGIGGWGQPIVGAAQKKKGSPGQRTLRRFNVGVDEAKLIVTKRFGITEPGKGYCHVPDTREPEWFAQATAEKLVTKLHRGFQHREWHKTRDRNEAFDCRVYAYAALKILKPVFAKLKQRAAEWTKENPQAAVVSPEHAEDRQERPPKAKLPPASKTKRKRKPRRRSSGSLMGDYSV